MGGGGSGGQNPPGVKFFSMSLMMVLVTTSQLSFAQSGARRTCRLVKEGSDPRPRQAQLDHGEVHPLRPKGTPIFPVSFFGGGGGGGGGGGRGLSFLGQGFVGGACFFFVRFFLEVFFLGGGGENFFFVGREGFFFCGMDFSCFFNVFERPRLKGAMSTSIPNDISTTCRTSWCGDVQSKTKSRRTTRAVHLSRRRDKPAEACGRVQHDCVSRPDQDETLEGSTLEQ